MLKEGLRGDLEVRVKNEQGGGKGLGRVLHWGELGSR